MCTPSARTESRKSKRFKIFSGIRDQAARPPIVVYSKPGAELACLVNGIHPRRVSAALGFAVILCLHLNRDEADACRIP